MTYQSTILSTEEVQTEMRLFEAHHLGGNKHHAHLNTTDGHYVLPAVQDSFAGLLSRAEYIKTQENNQYTLYWLHGKRQVIKGSTFAAAFTAAGYGMGAMPALDFYMSGDDNQYMRHGDNWITVVG